MVAPSKGYHGVKFWETFGDFAYTMKARMEVLRVHGAALAPLSAFLLLQGVETLHLRMERHCQNARRVAEFLLDAPARRLGQLARPAARVRTTHWHASTCAPSMASPGRQA